MPNDIISIVNPFAKLIPETVGVSINNDIINNPTPQKLHNAYRLGHVNGVMLDVEEHPWYIRKFAKYNYDYLKDNQEDGQPLIFEDTKYYSMVKDSGKGKRVLNNQYLKLSPKNGKSRQVTRAIVCHMQLERRLSNYVETAF